MTVGKETDWELTGALLDRLKQLNAQKGQLWQFVGTACEDSLTTSGKKLLREIIEQVGHERLVGLTEYGFDGNSNYQIHRNNFDNFVGVLENLIKQHSSKVNYEEAWNLLKGLARLLDNNDLIYFNYPKMIEGEISDAVVRLEQAIRIYLFKIVHTAKLKGMLYETFYDEESWPATTEPYQVCDEINFVEFCDSIRTIEMFIRSMTDNWDSFTFDIEELAIDGNPRVEMTLVDFFQHEFELCKKEQEREAL